MKFLDKIALVIFSIVILIIAIMSSLIIFEIIDFSVVYLIISNIFKIELARKIIIGFNIVFMLLALKAIFFDSSSKKDKYNDSILLENDDGKLIITKETLMGLINGVVIGFDGVENSQTKIILDEENNLSISLNIETREDIIIKDLINNLQINIKKKLKETLDIEVKELDIRVKNIVKVKPE